MVCFLALVLVVLFSCLCEFFDVFSLFFLCAGLKDISVWCGQFWLACFCLVLFFSWRKSCIVFLCFVGVSVRAICSLFSMSFCLFACVTF